MRTWKCFGSATSSRANGTRCRASGLDPAQHWGQGSWQDDHLFGPTHSNEAGDWYKVYFYGRYLFVPVSAQRLD